ncbi:hypothetical protein LMG8526HA_02186 [Lactococcus lactis]|nr:hypothetical protein [Lactococcus lactis]
MVSKKIHNTFVIVLLILRKILIKMFEEIYKQIEAEVIKIAYQISIDENQKNVYSLNIGELQLRIYTQLEAVLKSKYLKDVNISNKKKPYYDECIKPLGLQNKSILVYWVNYHLEKIFYDDVYIKTVNRLMEDGVTPNGNDMNYKFNNAYQNLRHSFERSLKVYGTIEYLFEALAALFIALDINSSQIFSKYKIDSTDSDKVLYWAKGTSSMCLSMEIKK